MKAKTDIYIQNPTDSALEGMTMQGPRDGGRTEQ